MVVDYNERQEADVTKADRYILHACDSIQCEDNRLKVREQGANSGVRWIKGPTVEVRE